MLHSTELLGGEAYDKDGHFVGHVTELFIEPADQPNRIARILLGRGKYLPLVARYDHLAFVAPGVLKLNVEEKERSEERRVGKECRSLCDWSSDVCSSDLSHFAWTREVSAARRAL